MFLPTLLQMFGPYSHSTIHLENALTNFTNTLCGCKSVELDSLQARKGTTKLQFDLHIGIDYSGAKTPTSRLSGIQVYSTSASGEPEIVRSPNSTIKKRRNWCRKEVANWLIEVARSGSTFIVGIDHGFSFPLSYLHQFEIRSWHRFLDDFCLYWPTIGDDTTVDSIRKQHARPPTRTGSSKELRLTEKWTPSAKSVFLFDVQGSVAKSTHAGLPWLQHIRDELNGLAHFWPFDGWHIPEGKCVLAEVYPSLFRRRYPTADRTTDQQDAFSVSRWLAQNDRTDTLTGYLDPSLSNSDRQVAEREGWILGVR